MLFLRLSYIYIYNTIEFTSNFILIYIAFLDHFSWYKEYESVIH